MPPPPRTTTFSAYERSVGFASIAIVVVCGRCVLHRLGSTTYKHPCLNSGRSISGILARPLPKVSFCCLSLAQPTIEGSPPRLSPLPQTPPTPHYPSPRTTKNSNSRLKQGCFTAVAQSRYARTHKDSHTKPLHDATAQMAVNAWTQ